MSKLSKETVEKLREIIREEYGRSLTAEETRMIAEDFVSYFDTLARIKHANEISSQEVVGGSSIKN